MKIPKHLQRPGMSEDRKRFLEKFVEESRKLMKKAPTYPTTEVAIKEAVKMAKREEYSFPSVWKEPEDIGAKHAVVIGELREDAHNAGYTQEVDEQKIFDLANGIKRDEADEIEEVD